MAAADGTKRKKQPKLKWGRLIVLGDSLSYSGEETPNQEFPVSPGFALPTRYEGRFTNGWNIVDNLRNSLNISTSRFHNFAAGNASTEDMLTQQLNQLLECKLDTNHEDGYIDLFVVFGGSNDFFPFLKDIGNKPWKSVSKLLKGSIKSEMEGTMKIVCERIRQILEELFEKAHGRYFLVPNIPNVLSNISVLKGVFKTYTSELTTSVADFNKSHPEAKAVLWDVSKNLTEMMSHGQANGFVSTTLKKNYEDSVQGGKPKDPEKTIFWDRGAHFTSRTHFMLSQKVEEVVKMEMKEIGLPEREEISSLRRTLVEQLSQNCESDIDRCKVKFFAAFLEEFQEYSLPSEGKSEQKRDVLGFSNQFIEFINSSFAVTELSKISKTLNSLILYVNLLPVSAPVDIIRKFYSMSTEEFSTLHWSEETGKYGEHIQKVFINQDRWTADKRMLFHGFFSLDDNMALFAPHKHKVSEEYRRCMACRKVTTTQCSRCHVVKFCSKDCLKRAWRSHKPMCKDLTNAGDNIIKLSMENNAWKMELKETLKESWEKIIKK